MESLRDHPQFADFAADRHKPLFNHIVPVDQQQIVSALCNLQRRVGHQQCIALLFNRDAHPRVHSRKQFGDLIFHRIGEDPSQLERAGGLAQDGGGIVQFTLMGVPFFALYLEKDRNFLIFIHRTRLPAQQLY